MQILCSAKLKGIIIGGETVTLLGLLGLLCLIWAVVSLAKMFVFDEFEAKQVSGEGRKAARIERTLWCLAILALITAFVYLPPLFQFAIAAFLATWLLAWVLVRKELKGAIIALRAGF